MNIHNEFLHTHIADALYSGRFSRFSKAEDLPHEIYDWIKTQYSQVQYVRIGAVLGEGPGRRMEWWVGAWKEARGEPEWSGTFWSEWRKI